MFLTMNTNKGYFSIPAAGHRGKKENGRLDAAFTGFSTTERDYYLRLKNICMMQLRRLESLIKPCHTNAAKTI
jgi:hypothetical protein